MFNEWWKAIGSRHVPELEEKQQVRTFCACREAWNAAVLASIACITKDGNPDVAKDKIAQLKWKN
jgi:hypothetical protein